MRRRELMLASGTLLVPPVAWAQNRRRRRLALFSPVRSEAELVETGDDANLRIFFEELRRRGYDEGRSLDIGRWSARSDPTRYPTLAREIIDSRPDLISTVNVAQVRALLAHTTTIPIIISNPEGADLVDAGLADSFSRPGRNVTGLSQAIDRIGVSLKLFEFLREAIPRVSRVLVLTTRAIWDVDFWRPIREATSHMGLTLVGAPMDEFQPAEFRRAFAAVAEQRIDAVWVPIAPGLWANRHLIVDLAMDSRVPAISFWHESTARGGLLSYGTDLTWIPRTLAEMIARVLEGESPADMPLRSNDNFGLVINLKTARALGLMVPQSLLMRADRVIE